MESVVTNKKASGEGGKLLKASKVALIGMGIAVLSGVFANIVNYFLSVEANRIMAKYVTGGNSSESVGMVGLAMQVAILVGFCWLAFSLRKSKSRAIAVNLIVFSSIFILFDMLLLGLSFVNSGFYEAVYKGITTQEIQVLNQMSYYTQAVLVLAIVAWAIVFAGGIIGVRAPESELEENRLVD